MQTETVESLTTWFDQYTHSFLSGDAEEDSPLVIKIEHTQRVRDNIRELADRIGLEPEKILLAETVALFHDLGRFEQYRDYHSYSDARSINHALKSVEVLEKNGVLNSLSAGEQKIVIDAVRVHNAPALPGEDTQGALLFMRLIRDADKLDIWKVIADYIRQDAPLDPVIFHHLPDLPDCSPKIIASIMQKRMALVKDIRCINDFKLLQLSWIYDLNFPATTALAKERGDMAVIAGSLPDADDIQRAVTGIMADLDEACAASSERTG